MSILEKAQELADALENSQELKAVQKMEKILTSDADASELMNRFRDKQMEVYNMQMAGEEPSDALADELNKMREELQSNQIIMEYLESQEALGKVLEQVNGIISRALQGDDCCSSGGCSSCAGC